MTKVLTYNLLSGTVIDRSVLVNSSSAEIQSMIDIFGDDKITVVDNAATFFTPANLIKLIEANDPKFQLVADQAKIHLRSEDIEAIQKAVELRKIIGIAATPPIPPYSFDPIPADWSVASNIKISNNKVMRLKPLDDYADLKFGTDHSLGLKMCEKLWLTASKVWSDPLYANYVNLRIGTYDSKTAYIEFHYIKVGCQSIKRFELEQLALCQSWVFPEAKGAA